MSHHTNSNSPAQSVNRWIAVSLMKEGNVLGVLYDPDERTITLSWVDDAFGDDRHLTIAVENVSLVADLLASARDALAREGAPDV